MDLRPDRIVRRDFPRSADGYDRAAVDAHLAAVAAAVGSGWSGESGSAAGPVEAERELRAGGQALLGEIDAMRSELKRASAGLRQHAAAIAETLDELDAGTDAPVGVKLGDPPGARAAGPPAADPLDPRATVRADARLVALDMALGGSSRDVIERELEARFDLTDRACLVDEVLAAIG